MHRHISTLSASVTVGEVREYFAPARRTGSRCFLTGSVTSGRYPRPSSPLTSIPQTRPRFTPCLGRPSARWRPQFTPGNWRSRIRPFVCPSSTTAADLSDHRDQHGSVAILRYLRPGPRPASTSASIPIGLHLQPAKERADSNDFATAFLCCDLTARFSGHTLRQDVSQPGRRNPVAASRGSLAVLMSTSNLRFLQGDGASCVNSVGRSSRPMRSPSFLLAGLSRTRGKRVYSIPHAGGGLPVRSG